MVEPRDWDKEMAEIDRLMAAEAKNPPSANLPSLPPGPQPRPSARSGVGGVEARSVSAAAGYRPITVWAIALLGPVGAVGLAMWPYAKPCGFSLALYLVGVAGVIGAAVWGMRTGWLTRRGTPLVIGLLTLLAALWLVGAEVLPRIGYAAVSHTWICSN